MNHIEQRESGFISGPNGSKVKLRSLTCRVRSKVSALMADGQPIPELARLVELAREDLEAHDGDWSRAGFQALLVHRFGNWRMSIRSRLLRAPFTICSRALFTAVRNFYGIELPFSARVGRRVILEHQHGIVIHGNSVIGDDCIIRQGVTLGIRRMDRLTEAPILGRGVNVGAGAKILGRVYIGDHADIGANAVVLEDVPAHALAIGVPARNILRDPARANRDLDPAARREHVVHAVPEIAGAPRSRPANSNAADATLDRDASVGDGTHGAAPGSSRAGRNGAASTRASALAARSRPN